MKTLELVVYSINPESVESFPAAREKMRGALTRWKGFRSGVTFRSVEKKTAFADFYMWDSLEEALEAANAIQTDKDARDFLGCIDQIVSFEHFSMDEDRPCFSVADTDDVLEVALGVVDGNQREKFAALKPELFSLVRQEKGLAGITSADKDTAEGILCLDALRWRSMDEASAAMKHIHETEQCGAFMGLFVKDVYFDHMRRYPNAEVGS